MIKHSTLLLFFIAFFIPCSYAAPDSNKDVPELVYRVDRRHYSDVFKNGFKAWGYDQPDANLNVADHVSGRSCTLTPANRNSIFISTTASRKFIEALARKITAKLNRGEHIAIYTIHPDRNTYEAFRSLVWLSDNHYFNVSPNEFTMAMTQYEWIAVGRIENTSIESATVYFIEDDRIRVEEHRNPYFVFYPERVANTSPFSQYTLSRPRSEWRIWLQESLYPLVSQCFSHDNENASDVFILQKNRIPEFSSFLSVINVF